MMRTSAEVRDWNLISGTQPDKADSGRTWRWKRFLLQEWNLLWGDKPARPFKLYVEVKNGASPSLGSFATREHAETCAQRIEDILVVAGCAFDATSIEWRV
jgi:hypothetical protein